MDDGPLRSEAATEVQCRVCRGRGSQSPRRLCHGGPAQVRRADFIRETRHAANAAVSLVTNADYARFPGAALNGAGLSPSSHAALLEPEVALTSRSLFSPPGTDAGTNRPHRLAWTPGWGTFSDAYGRSIFHVGREEGCENYVEARLDRGPGIVILSAGTSSDSFSSPLVDAAIGSAYSPLAWLEYGRPIPSEPAAQALGWGLAGLALLLLVLVLWRTGWLARRVSRR